LKIVLATFLALVFLWLYVGGYDVIKISMGISTYHDVPGWKMQMTEEETIKHMTPEEAEEFIKWREEIKKHNLEKNRASDKTKGE